MTKFRLLSKDASGYWSDLGEVEAKSRKAALTSAVSGNGDAKALVAVRTVEWAPVVATVQTQTVVKFDTPAATPAAAPVTAGAEA